MVAFGHTSVGVLIGVATIEAAANNTSYWLLATIAFVIGVISHYITDSIPHGHYDIDTKNLTKKALIIFLVDSFGFFALVMTFATWKLGISASLFVVVMAVIGAQAPDIWNGFKKIVYEPSNSLSRAEQYIHLDIAHWHNEPDSPITGGGRPWRITDIWQICVFVLAFFFLLLVD